MVRMDRGGGVNGGNGWWGCVVGMDGGDRRMVG